MLFDSYLIILVLFEFKSDPGKSYNFKIVRLKMWKNRGKKSNEKTSKTVVYIRVVLYLMMRGVWSNPNHNNLNIGFVGFDEC